MKIGAATIGQSPRDDIIPEIRDIMGPDVEIIEAGALDGLSLEEVKDFYPGPTDFTLVTRMKDGTAKEIIETANKVKNSHVDLIVLDCIDFNRETKAIFREVTQKPVLLPRTILGKITREILEVK